MKTLTKVFLIPAFVFVSSSPYFTEGIDTIIADNSDGIYKRDPKIHVKGKTHDQVTRFNQIYFTNEANFGSCNSKCTDYATPRNHSKLEEYKYDQRQCHGTIHSCQNEYSRFYFFWIPKQKETDMRYYAVSSKKLWQKTLVDKYGKMPHSNQYKKVEFNAWKRGFVICDMCRCMCDEENDQKSVRKFSLAPVMSDVNENKVVTGMQIQRKGQTFYLKIRQAPLLPLGKTNNTESQWKSVDDPEKTPIYKLSISHNKMHIGTVKAQPKEVKSPEAVVTGVKFTEISGNLVLEVHYTNFDYVKGVLNKDAAWVSNAFSSKMIDTGKNRPTKYHDNVLSKQNQGLVQFGPSNVYDDVGQSTVPFLDLQAVESSNALAGVGLQLKTRTDSGGFITPHLVSY